MQNYWNHNLQSKQQQITRGPFLQSPDNFSGPKSNIQIEI